MLDLKRLRVFREVAEHRSFSAAADALNYSQPAVSHHISRLESELGVRLFDRRTARDGIQLTDAGQTLVAHAERVLDAAESAEAQMHALASGRGIPIRVAAFAAASATFVADAVAAVRKAEPSVAFALDERDAADALRGVVARRADLAIVVDERRDMTVPPAGCTFEPLFDDPMLVALPATHPLAGAGWIDLGDLSADPWIDGVHAGAPGSTLLRDACQAAGFVPRVALASDDYRVVSRLVASGQGVGLVPLLAVAEPRPGIVVRRVRSRPHRRVSMAMAAGERPSPDLTLTLTALRAQARRCRRRASALLAAADPAGPLPAPTVLRPVA